MYIYDCSHNKITKHLMIIRLSFSINTLRKKINRERALITVIIIWQNMVWLSYNYSLLLPQLYSWINERNNDSHYMMLYLHMIILRLNLRDTLTKKMKIRTVLYSCNNESCNDSHYTMLYLHMIILQLYLWDTLTNKT